MKKKISILGCGWLGLPLGAALAEQGYTVKGSTTKLEKLDNLRHNNIEGFHITLGESPDGSFDSFLKTDILLVNIPPSNKKSNLGFKQQLEGLLSQVLRAGIKKVLFISTTAVYPNVNRIVTESDATYVSSPHSGTKMLEMEEVFTKNDRFRTTVIRFGGLYGPSRNPGRFLSGKKNLTGGNHPINMIHLEDCIGVIKKVLQADIWGEIFNACAPKHPTRASFYTKASLQAKLKPPLFLDDEKSSFKIVSSDKLISRTGYSFKYANPTESLDA